MADPRTSLAAERAQALASIDALTRDVGDYFASASSTTGDDEHDPEGATIGFERAQAIALLAQARDHLAEVEAALDRLAGGDYGVCRSCGVPIGVDRLAARPSATLCIDCAR
jgi:DnaK suppressor protein